MKKTKLLTSIAALALVLGLGACGGAEDEETTATDESGTTSETPESGDSGSEPTAYALVGAFADADWDNEPSTDSKYYIPAKTETYEVTITTADEPDYGEWDPWNAGLRVVEYGTWNLVAGYGQLDAASTGVLGEGDDKNIAVSWNATYDLTITLGDNPSILVTLVEEDNGHIVDGDAVDTPAALINKAIEKASYSLDLVIYEYETPSITNSEYVEGNYSQDDLIAQASLVDTYRLLVYCTEDAIEMDKYILVDDAWVASESEIDVNYNNASYVFKNTNVGDFSEYTYGGKLTSMGYSCSDWADAYYSLFDLSGRDALTDDDFTFISEDNGVLSYDASEVAADLALCTGFDYWYDSADRYAEAATLDYLYFYPALQEIETYYTCGRWADAYVDNTGGSSDRYFFGYDFAIDIFNVGTTDLTAIAESLIELIAAE